MTSVDLPDNVTAHWCRYTLRFNFVAQTSRMSMTQKRTYFIRLTSPEGRTGIAEVPLFEGLSAEDSPEFEQMLSQACANPSATLAGPPCSSIAFGFEAAATRLASPRPTLWQNGQEGIAINGLIWMGDKELMRKRIAAKLDDGFKVLKLKIGGIDFDDEVQLLRDVRKHFSADNLELRLDANGSFNTSNAMSRLDTLARFDIHSIEQPLPAGMPDQTARLCRTSPIAIALDEELIGMRSTRQKKELLQRINPQYIILKPALCGGFAAADEYAEIIGKGRWWATSALESNVGLYDIASWLSRKSISMPQGLGTGMLYTNNIASPLYLNGSALFACKHSTTDPFDFSDTLSKVQWNN